MTSELLTAILAERVMGWTVSPGRFMMGGRRWLPRWRFQPTENLGDAFKLLEKAKPQDYALGNDGNGFWVRISIGTCVGEARDASKARAITLAIARAIGVEPDACPRPKTGVERR